jgi:hypothetical protein
VFQTSRFLKFDLDLMVEAASARESETVFPTLAPTLYFETDEKKEEKTWNPIETDGFRLP